MSCSPFDLRDYLLEELGDAERRQVDTHLKTCAGCREELEQLRLTQSALLSVREEEIPQRIAFVSDKVFEPSPARRLWQAFWGSTARLGFAGAAILSVAILVSALTRPAPAPAPAAVVAVGRVQLEREFDARLQDGIRKAVAESETRQEQKTAELLAAAERRHEIDLKQVQLAVEENFDGDAQAVQPRHPGQRRIRAKADEHASADPVGGHRCPGRPGAQTQITHAMLKLSEKAFDARLEGVGGDDRFMLLGTTRGVYLAGFGAVFSAEVNLFPGVP